MEKARSLARHTFLVVTSPSSFLSAKRNTPIFRKEWKVAQLALVAMESTIFHFTGTIHFLL
jgi:hypothetical protein